MQTGGYHQGVPSVPATTETMTTICRSVISAVPGPLIKPLLWFWNSVIRSLLPRIVPWRGLILTGDNGERGAKERARESGGWF